MYPEASCLFEESLRKIGEKYNFFIKVYDTEKENSV